MLRLTLAAVDPRRNRILAALPAVEWARVDRNLEPVFLPLGEALCETGLAFDHVYFPATSLVSLLTVLADGASDEITVVGNEGIVGIGLFLGGGSTPGRAVVAREGWAYRLPGHSLREEFMRGGALQHLLLRYTQVLITQAAQAAVCNRFHSVNQQLCRWLLLSLDRLRSAELRITHERIANVLGVRREGITEAAGALQRSGLIHHSRGRITILDRAGLLARSCECYGVVTRESDRLLGQSGRTIGQVPWPIAGVEAWQHGQNLSRLHRPGRDHGGIPLTTRGRQRHDGLPASGAAAALLGAETASVGR